MKKQSIWKNKPFILIWLSFFIGTAANVTMLVAVSVKIFMQSGSTVGAAAIFVSRWVAPLFLTTFVGKAITRFSATRLIGCGGIASAAIAVTICLVVGKAVVFVYLLVLCRGAFEIAIKTANTVAIRKLLDDDMISDAASVFNTSNYIGGALGAALAVPMMQYFGSTAVLGSCAVLFLIGGILAFSLSASDVSNVDHGEKLHPSVLDILLKRTVVSPEVAESLFMLFVVVTAFQSYHDAVRTVFPLAELGMGESGVGLLQALTFVSLMFSAFFYSKFLSDSGRLSGTRDASLMLLACLFLNLSAAGMGAFVSLASYFFFIFFFELAYIQSTRRILLFTSRDEIVSVSSIQWLVVSLGMIVGTISIANLVEHFGMVVTNLLVSAVVIAWVIFDSLRKRERERAKRSQPA